MSEKTKYVLEMDEEQVVTINAALEFYARIMVGQWQEIGERCLDLADDDYCDKKEKLDKGLAKLRPIAFPDLPADLSASRGVTAVDKALSAWEIYEVLRHRLAWTRYPEGGWGVDFQKPISFSGKELVKCTVKEDSEGTLRPDEDFCSRAEK